MMLVAVLITVLATVYGVIIRMTVREWIVYGSLLVIALIASALITWHVWPNLQPLAWLYFLFQPPTKWFYRIL